MSYVAAFVSSLTCVCGCTCMSSMDKLTEVVSLCNCAQWSALDISRDVKVLQNPTNSM